MRGVFVLLGVLVFLVSLVYAQNLDIVLYRERESGIRELGDIKAVPGETINAFIQIENSNDDRSDDDQDIENIEISLTIEDIDDEGDIDLEFDDFDLVARRKKSLAFTFQVPMRIEDDSYLIQIEAIGSEAGDSFAISEVFYVDVEKERHDLFFKKLKFDPQVAKCNEVTYLDIEVYNLGQMDEDVELQIRNDYLELSFQRGFLVERYPGDDFYSERIPIKIPRDMPLGSYPFDLLFKYGRQTQSKEVVLQVNCNGEPSDVSEDAPQGDSSQTTFEDSEPRGVVVYEQPDDQSLPPIIKKDVATSASVPVIIFILVGGIIAALVVVFLLKMK